MTQLSPILSTNIEKAVNCLRQSDTVCILTGAGISAESGIPTFRDKQTGLWENYRAEDLANAGAFERDPNLVWSWYQWRRNLVKDKQPNPAHHALARWQQAWQQQNKAELTLITQNVDDLHEQAGSIATHLHGHLWKNRCSKCDAIYDMPIDYTDAQLIHCPHCQGFIRPDIVWFGEGLPVDEWLHAKLSARTCQVFITIGTSSIVYPAAGLVDLAKYSPYQAKIIEINPNPTDNPMVDIQIQAKAGEALPQLVNQLLSE
ncbi:SIR2 family NAD-dependent protein deacylase [Psychrobacter sp. I-STPA10]|uniref:SIR2 family NAD-dependent protein deacylase n=1 Tax=Psychrobacter sp. I-STPA10 TaxID=2585769 RepID=UPI001E4C152F|nr:NAD-dependent deacylase [Psychrobacter sp. I-STPA10]